MLLLLLKLKLTLEVLLVLEGEPRSFLWSGGAEGTVRSGGAGVIATEMVTRRGNRRRPCAPLVCGRPPGRRRYICGIGNGPSRVVVWTLGCSA